MRLCLFVDLESFLVKTRVDGDVGNLGGIVVIELLNIITHATTVSFDCREDQEILEVLILAKWRWLQDNLFE